MNTSPQITEINEYLVDYIFYYLTERDIYILFETCKTFYLTIKNNVKLKRRPLYNYEVVTSINMLIWAQTHSDFQFNSQMACFAIRRNKLKVLKYLHSRGCPLDRYCYREAIYNDDIYTVKWLKKRRLQLTEDTFSAAAEVGNLKILKWLKRNDCPFNHIAVNAAAYSGNLKALRFLIKNGCEWEIGAFNCACVGGNLKSVMYLFNDAVNDLSKPWLNESVCASAAKYGRLEILKYLKSFSCPWDISTSWFAAYFAIETGKTDVLKWVLENGCPVEASLYEVLYSKFRLEYDINEVTVV